MTELAYGWDVFFFRWINEGWSSRSFDAFFMFVTDARNPWNWFFITLGVLWLISKGGLKGRCVLVALVLSVGLSDLTAARLLKPAVARVRPCNVLANVRTPMGGSGSFSFPSNHAANQGAAMSVLSLAYPPAMPYFAAVAIAVGLSRIYLGLHYPSDILGGYVLGMIFGIFFWWKADAWRIRWLNRHHPLLSDRKKGS